MLTAGLPAPEVRAQSQAAGQGTPASKAGAQHNSSSAAAAGFIKADTFQGTRTGYAFKAGPQGMGYYLDK